MTRIRQKSIVQIHIQFGTHCVPNHKLQVCSILERTGNFRNELSGISG